MGLLCVNAPESLSNTGELLTSQYFNVYMSDLNNTLAECFHKEPNMGEKAANFLFPCR